MRFIDRLDKQIQYILENESVRRILYVYRKGDMYVERYLDIYRKYGYPFGRIASCDELVASDPRIFWPDKELYIIYLTSESGVEQNVYDAQTGSNMTWIHSQYDVDAVCEYFQDAQRMTGLRWMLDVVYLRDRHNSSARNMSALNDMTCNKVWVVNSDMEQCNVLERDKSMDFLGMMSVLMIQNVEGYSRFLTYTSEHAMRADIRCFDMVGIQNNIQMLDRLIWKDINHGFKGQPSDEARKQIFDNAIQTINNYMHIQLSPLLVGLDYFPVFTDSLKGFKGKEVQLGYALKLMYGENRDMWKQVYDLSYENVCDRLEEAWHDESLTDIFPDIPYGFWVDTYCRQMLLEEYHNVNNRDITQVLTNMHVNSETMRYSMLPTKYNNVAELVRTVDRTGYFGIEAELALERAVWKYIKLKLDDARDQIAIKNLSQDIARQIVYMKESIPCYNPNMRVSTQSEFLNLCVELQNQDINKQWKMVGSTFNMTGANRGGAVIPVNGINDNNIFMISIMPV